jgi:hypothetical protein
MKSQTTDDACFDLAKMVADLRRILRKVITVEE